MNATEIIGFSAMCLSSIKHVPQIYKIHNEDNVESFSKQAIIFALLSSLLWTYYGYVKHSPSILVGSSFAIIYELYLLYKIINSEYNKEE